MNPAPHTRRRRFFPLFYIVLFLVAFIAPVIGYFRLLRAGTPDLPLAAWVTAICGAFSLALLIAVYYDVEQLDSLDSHDPDYPNWADNLSERILRAAIMLCLLFGVGEFGHAIAPAIRMIAGDTSSSSAFNLCSCSQIGFKSPFWLRVYEFLADDGSGTGLFGWGAFLSFALMVVWNIRAVICRQAYKRENPSNVPEGRLHDTLVTIRIYVFIFIAALNSVFWGMVVFGIAWAFSLAELGAMLFVALSLLYFCLRIGETWFERKLKDSLDLLGGAATGLAPMSTGDSEPGGQV